MPHKEKLSPLEYLIGVVNDPAVDPHRRDTMALAAMPYCHAKVEGRPISKKQETAKAARKAVRGGSVAWGNDLRTSSNGQSD